VDYPFESIELNGREIALSDIARSNIISRNPFEKTTLEFIGQWLNGEQEFYLTTSGSTGSPKPMTILRQQMEQSAVATEKALSLRRGSHALVCLDTNFIAGKMMLVRCFTSGLYVRAVTPSANPLANINWGNQVHFVAFVPYQLHAILHSPEAAFLNQLENIIIGGAPLAADMQKELQSFRCKAFLTYGMTETISHIALKRLNGEEASSLFRTLPGVFVDIDDRSCLIIHCPYISAKVVTNDIVRLIDQTTFDWVGRFDNVINSGGLKISPEELERQIEEVSGLDLHRKAVISAIPDRALGEKLVLVCEGGPLKSGQKNRIIDLLSQELPKFSVPKDIICLSSFPLTRTGKVNRIEIAKLISRQA
jgi:O-succinylbenzoic acid--CoA ligase